MTLGEQNTQEEDLNKWILLRSRCIFGIQLNYIHTPKRRNLGHTEIIIGNWFKERKRNEIILQLKFQAQQENISEEEK